MKRWPAAIGVVFTAFAIPVGGAQARHTGVGRAQVIDMIAYPAAQVAALVTLLRDMQRRRGLRREGIQRQSIVDRVFAPR